ncbi:family 20 glycosylhydrolase [Urechidicola vernalis]|uniref:beta-N-acetylhexosaminidase n=1 Tax=Urechidicola vernalis TaxID=3075600 RepID=A0ABU2Y394_9FLAO|nr:family 20 glycosylhydrolase [Urechidicola sp. P050]MDT0552682.1 family 20 glycosylhydrolase [Urechidicola sp. P050]
MTQKLRYVFLFLNCIMLSSIAQENHFITKFSAEELKNAPVKLIPYPQEVKWGAKSLKLSGCSLQINPELSGYHVAIENEIREIFSNYSSNKSGVNIVVEFDPDLKAEAYNLNVSKKGIEIEASSASGVFYALQTLKQMVLVNDDKTAIPYCRISDYPQHSVRGYMIDVGRNYQSMESLKKQLDFMAMYKFNTFHWHLTDRPAWRIESNVYPQLTYASNHWQTRDPGVFYTYEEIRDIIAYAKERHITVIPEIDMPGHSDSFKLAMGFTMESEKGMKALTNILNEFFQEIPKEDCPIIHIGSDEVKIPNQEEFIEHMVNVCKQGGREVVIWNPGLEATDDVVRQTWEDKDIKKGNFREIDSWLNYVNTAEPMVQIQRLFFKPIGYPSPNKVIGGTLCFWPDVNLRHESDAFEQNPVYSSIATYAWKAWTADFEVGIPEYYTKMPPKGGEAYKYFSVFEDYLLKHKHTIFKAEPFLYFRQNDKEWNLIGAFNGDEGDEILREIKHNYEYNGKTIKWEKVIGNTLVFNERHMKMGYFDREKKGVAVYALTYIHSDKEREIDAMIGFETAERANKIHSGIPFKGTWDQNGGNIWVNDEQITPPDWKDAGWKSEKRKGWGSKADQEVPWEKQDFYWTRNPSKIKLKKGWNKVFAKIPYGSNYQNWMFTFIPVEMDGIRFSADKK